MNLFNKLQKMKMLLIDDDEWIRDSMVLFFESEGCGMLALETAEEGIAALQSQPYDIIISDYRLPGMDGVAFFKQIEKSVQHSLKLLITAYGSEEVISEAKNAGVHDCIEKPFTTEIIEASLLRLLTGQPENTARPAPEGEHGS